MRVGALERTAETDAAVPDIPRLEHVAPLEAPADRCGGAGARHTGGAAAEQSVGERAVVRHRDIRHVVRGDALLEVDLHRACGRSYGPEESVPTKTGIVVGNLVCIRREGVNLTPIDIESDEREGPLVSQAIGSAEGSLHEAHVRIEQELLDRTVRGPPYASAINYRRANETVEISD